MKKNLKAKTKLLLLEYSPAYPSSFHKVQIREFSHYLSQSHLVRFIESQKKFRVLSGRKYSFLRLQVNEIDARCDTFLFAPCLI